MSGRADYLDEGNWNAVCYECGRKRKASELRKHWQGYWVCPEHWEARQPQDFARGVKDDPTPPWVQPKSKDSFILNGTWIPGNGITTADRYIPPYSVPKAVTGLSGSITILAPGSGYTVGDVLSLPSYGCIAPGGVAATVTVNAINANGGITGVTPSGSGSYTCNPTCTSSVSTLKALLHFDGLNGATSTADDASNTVVIATGSTLSTTQAKFGSASLLMNALINPGATNRGATLSGITTLGSGGWTAECWWYNPTGVITWRPIYASNASTYLGGGFGVQLIYSSVGNNLALYASSNGTTWDIANAVSSTTQTFNAGWNHVALTFDTVANKYLSYVNGINAHSVASASVICPISNIWIVPSDYNGAELTLTAWIDEWALSSVCRYPNGVTFTPPVLTFVYQATGCGVVLRNGTGANAVITLPPVIPLIYANLNPVFAPPMVPLPTPTPVSTVYPPTAQPYIPPPPINLVKPYVPILPPRTYADLNKSYAAASNLSNLNLIFQGDLNILTTWSTLPGTIYRTVNSASSDVLYAEFTFNVSADFMVGLTTAAAMNGGLAPGYLGQVSGSYGYSITGVTWWGGNLSTLAGLVVAGGTTSVGTTLGLLFTLSTGTMQVRAGNGSFVQMFTGLVGAYAPAMSVTVDVVVVTNFGQNPWIVPPPAGASGWFSGA